MNGPPLNTIREERRIPGAPRRSARRDLRARVWRRRPRWAFRPRASNGGPGPTRYPSSVSDTWLIEPSGPLRGEVEVRGSKNAVTKHMVAAILGSGPSTITNVPEVGDVDITASILTAIGAHVERTGSSITVAPPECVNPTVPLSFSGLNRIPVLLLGPLLHLAGEAFVPRVGGDQLGSRPVDFHVEALRALGAEIEVTPEGIAARCSRLRGGIIELPYPSVGATESALLSASLAEGKSVIRGAATEPEVLELALFLQRMGARIELRPDRRIVIEGVPNLRGARNRLQGDRNEAFSYLVAGLLTAGEVRVVGCGQDRLVTAITTLMQHGGQGRCRRRRHDGVVSRRVAGRGRADRRAPRIHDRLANAAHGPLHPGRRHVGAARDGVRGSLRVRAGPSGHGWRDRVVRQLPRRSGLPVPRDEQRAFRGRPRCVASCAAQRSRFPMCEQDSPVSSRRRPRTDLQSSAACTTSSGVITVRPNSCARWASICARSDPHLSRLDFSPFEVVLTH